MRNDIHAETSCRDFVDSQADPVESDRALRSGKPFQTVGHLENDPHRLGFGSPPDDVRDAVYMSRDEMPAQFVADPQRFLEVHRRTLYTLADCRARQDLGRLLNLNLAVL